MVPGLKFSAVMGLGVCLAAGAAMGQQPGGQTGSVATLTIQADKPVGKVSPTLYGLMTEEINYSYEGGLYGEMVSNRNFIGSWSGVDQWVLTPFGSAAGMADNDKTVGPSAALPSSMKV